MVCCIVYYLDDGTYLFNSSMIHSTDKKDYDPLFELFSLFVSFSSFDCSPFVADVDAPSFLATAVADSSSFFPSSSSCC